MFFATSFMYVGLFAVLLVVFIARLYRAHKAVQARDELQSDLDYRERLAAQAVGGAPDRPFAVDTPAVIDLRAAARPCPLCAGKLRFEEQTVEKFRGELLRVTHLVCLSCHQKRKFWFRLTAALPN